MQKQFNFILSFAVKIDYVSLFIITGLSW